MVDNTFTITAIFEKFCDDSDKDNKYFKFDIQGELTADTTSETKWTPTFSSPSNPTANCIMKASKKESANIKCNITSAINKEDVTLIKLTAEGINELNIKDSSQSLGKDVECMSCFISLTKLLLLFVFILF